MEIEKILANLVSFNTVSKNPNRQAVEYVKQLLEEQGFTADIISADGKFCNLIAKNKKALEFEKLGKNHISFCAHIDTVDYKEDEWNNPPLSLTKKDGRLYGLGAADMKGPLSCMLKAIKETSGENKPLGVVITHSEELGLVGAKELVEKTDLGFMNLIIGEPSRLELAYSHKSVCKFNIKIKGQEAHSSNPEKGLNAIYAAAEVTGLLEQTAKSLNSCSEGRCKLNLGVISGGDSLNKVCGQVIIKGDMRLVPDYSSDKMLEKIKACTKEAEKKGFCVYVEKTMEAGSFYQEPKEGFIFWLSNVLECYPVTLGYSTDAAVFNGKCGINCAIFGPGDISVCHKANEYIEVDELEKAVEKYKKIILNQ